jgi:hypothetical protein
LRWRGWVASQMPLPRTLASPLRAVDLIGPRRRTLVRSPHGDAISCGLIWVWLAPFILFAAFCQIEALTSAPLCFPPPFPCCGTSISSSEPPLPDVVPSHQPSLSCRNPSILSAQNIQLAIPSREVPLFQHLIPIIHSLKLHFPAQANLIHHVRT